ncbi:MAG: hypothetical protein V1928_01320 [Parcubacteria group bacterium]
MFDDQTTPPLNPQPQTDDKKVVDIFESVDKKPAPSAQPNPMPPKPPVAAPIPTAGGPIPFKYEDHGGKKHKVMFLVIIAIIVIVLVFVAGKIYFMRQTPAAAPAVSTPAENTAPADEIAQPEAIPSENLPNIPAPADASINSDADSLIDAQEAEFGTNPLKADTDNDGLNDYDEAMVYMTNPLNPDTDGDSFLDGDEVSHGYDPKGPGKLLNLQSGTNNATAVSSNSTQ